MVRFSPEFKKFFKISIMVFQYDELLAIFWENHDPTQGDRQGKCPPVLENRTC